ncbi:MAG: type I-U CRISPR-associated helicase/endonuclease Cas3 [Candidatus Omnitrophota bacterium]
MSFPNDFHDLTGHWPFPWQEKLYKRFLSNDIPPSCNIPTGLGKTNVIAIWLIALKENKNLPRRLVYVVNRRTVVDQTTEEAVKLRINAAKIGIPDLAISTLRGQFADNREWSADPSKPAIICGTVDMIGSRLLFSGYGCGFKSKPLHAGFLGQDALLVHDEAHLEPAFQKLIESIRREQHERERTDILPWSKLRVVSLSATSRNDKNNDKTESDKPFELTDDEKNPQGKIPDPPTEPIHLVWLRLTAKKRLEFHQIEDKKDALVKKFGELAAKYKDKNCTVLIFVRTIEDVFNVEKALKKTDRPIVLLTGTIRGKERDDLVNNEYFKRFLKDAKPGPTVFLLCTSAGEVGIDISADHMICDLTPFDSMAQRLGRVHRYGEPREHKADIDVVYPMVFNEKDKLTPASIKSLELIKSLDGDASPLALMTKLNAIEKADAFTPKPTILTATDILFDAWSMTTIRQKMPGRPPVEPYLHGIRREWEPPETHVAWRDEVEIITKELSERYELEDLLEDYPLKPHELLRDTSKRVFGHLKGLADEYPDSHVWLVDFNGIVEIKSMKELEEKTIEQKTILLPPSVGGLTSSGTLDGKAVRKKRKDNDTENEQSTEPKNNVMYDVADEWFVDNERKSRRRERLWDDAEPPKGMRLVRRIDVDPDADERGSSDEESARKRFWLWYARPRSADDDLSMTAVEAVKWDRHTKDVEECAKNNTDVLLKDYQELRDAVVLAAKFHDLGKKREFWQRRIGNPNPAEWYAKSGKDSSTGKRWIPHDICPNYRHEFGSLLDLLDPKKEYHTEFNRLSDEMKDVVLHLIAAHHGFARPHFPHENAYDLNYSEGESNRVAVEVMQRFARLQRKFGRWGLAYLESLLRAADYATSANPSPCETVKQEASS